MTALCMLLPSGPLSTSDKIGLFIEFLIMAPLALILGIPAFVLLITYLGMRRKMANYRAEISIYGEAEQITGTVKAMRQGDDGLLYALVAMPEHGDLPREMWLAAGHQTPGVGMPFPVYIFTKEHPCYIDAPQRMIMTKQDMEAACLRIDMDIEKAEKSANRMLAFCILFAAAAAYPLIYTLDYFFNVLV